MAVITRNEYGIVAINNAVLEKLIVDDMLSLSSYLIPCSRKGALLHHRIWNGLGDMLKAVNVEIKGRDIYVDVNFAVLSGISYQEAADVLFKKVEDDFEILCLDKPRGISAHIMGTVSDQKEGNGRGSLFDRKKDLIPGEKVLTKTND